MYKNILIPIDLSNSQTAGAMIRTGVALADGGAALTLLYVAPEIPTSVSAYLPAGSLEKANDESAVDLAKLAEQHGLAGRATTLVAMGNPHHEILAKAGEIGADLIVISSHRPEFSDYFLGSTAAHVVRHAECSVHVMR